MDALNCLLALSCHQIVQICPIKFSSHHIFLYCSIVSLQNGNHQEPIVILNQHGVHPVQSYHGSLYGDFLQSGYPSKIHVNKMFHYNQSILQYAIYGNTRIPSYILPKRTVRVSRCAGCAGGRRKGSIHQGPGTKCHGLRSISRENTGTIGYKWDIMGI